MLLATVAYNFKRAMKALLDPILNLVRKAFEMLLQNSFSMKYIF